MTVRDFNQERQLSRWLGGAGNANVKEVGWCLARYNSRRRLLLIRRGLDVVI
jgi:hypothetical protein